MLSLDLRYDGTLLSEEVEDAFIDLSMNNSAIVLCNNTEWNWMTTKQWIAPDSNSNDKDNN